VLADTHGNTIHLGERDCSVQRRHQKLIEETPSPVVSDDLRRRMGAASVRAAEAVGYTSAGTLEYLVSGEEFFFLEMNTRIQVEHTVTEAVTGLDLVREQVRVAAGERLSVTQDQVAARGHAFECRINAEDAEQRFLPTPGPITAYREPSGPGVRVDSGVRAGSVIPEIYDPMVAKLVTWDVDRESARRRMLRALDEYVVEGITTLIPFHRWLMDEEEFIAGGACHSTLARLADTPTRIPPPAEGTEAPAIPGDPAPDGEPTVARALTAEVGGRRFEVTLHIPESQAAGALAPPAAAARPRRKKERSGGDGGGGGAPNEVVTPMQGTVLRVLVEPGQEIEAGTVIAIIEAMKMENEVPAHRAGTVGEVRVEAGQAVQPGGVLATID
jgi:acetyl-CoA/propionyl-CoA carboxylase, biotin carboxylase, biotin carboxyl carrier protein